jgi:hypothetical protein
MINKNPSCEHNILSVSHVIYQAAKTDIKLIIQGETMTSKQMGLIMKQFSSPDEICHKEKGTFEKERIDI